MKQLGNSPYWTNPHNLWCNTCDRIMPKGSHRLQSKRFRLRPAHDKYCCSTVTHLRGIACGNRTIKGEGRLKLAELLHGSRCPNTFILFEFKAAFHITPLIVQCRSRNDDRDDLIFKGTRSDSPCRLLMTGYCKLILLLTSNVISSSHLLSCMPHRHIHLWHCVNDIWMRRQSPARHWHVTHALNTTSNDDVCFPCTNTLSSIGNRLQSRSAEAINCYGWNVLRQPCV